MRVPLADLRLLFWRSPYFRFEHGDGLGAADGMLDLSSTGGCKRWEYKGEEDVIPCANAARASGRRRRAMHATYLDDSTPAPPCRARRTKRGWLCQTALHRSFALCRLKQDSRGQHQGLHCRTASQREGQVLDRLRTASTSVCGR